MSRLPFNMGRDTRSREHLKVEIPRTGSLRSILHDSTNNLPNFDGNAMADKVKSLGADNHELRMALQEANAELKLQKEHSKRLTDEIQRMNFEARDNAQSNLSQMQSLRDTIDTLSKEKSRLVEECARSQLQVAQANKVKAEVEVKLVRGQEEVKQYQYLEKALTTLKKDNEELGIEVERLRNQLKSPEVPRPHERSTSKGKHEQLQQQEQSHLSHKRQQSEQLKAQLEELIEKLQHANQSLEHELFIHRQKVEWLEQDKKDLEARHQQAATSLSATAEFYRRQLEEAMLELQSQSTKLRYVEQKHDEVKEKAACVDQLIRELSQQRKHSEQLRLNLHLVETKISVLEQVQSEKMKALHELTEVNRCYSQLLHKHEEQQLEIRSLNEQSKQIQEQHKSKLEALMKIKTEEWRKSNEQISTLKSTRERLEEESALLKEANSQLKGEVRALKDNVTQLKMQLEHLQQKSEQLGQYEQTRARSELSEAYKELSKLKDELKFSQNDSTRTKGELIEVSREVLRLKEELKYNLQKYLTERDSLSHELQLQEQSFRDKLSAEKQSIRQSYEKQRQSYEAQLFVKVKSLESDMQNAQHNYQLKIERLEKEQQISALDRNRQQRSSNNLAQTEELLEVINHLEQKIAEQQDSIFHYTQRLLEKDTLLASRAAENDQRKDIILLLDKLKEEETRSDRLNQRVIELEQSINQKDSVLVHVRQTAQQSREGHQGTIASYDRMVKQLQQQLQQTCEEVVHLKREVDRLQAENSSMQHLSLRNQKILQNIDEEFSTAQKKLHDHKKNEMLLTEHLNKVQDQRKRRLTLFGKLQNKELFGRNSSCEETLIESFVTYCNTLEVKLQSAEHIKKMNTQLQESVELANRQLELLREKISQLTQQSKADRNLIIKMEDDHNRNTLERARAYQQQYDALLVKYEKYKNIAKREKSRKDAQKAIIRESNEFNEVIVQKCKAIIR